MNHTNSLSRAVPGVLCVIGATLQLTATAGVFLVSHDRERILGQQFDSRAKASSLDSALLDIQKVSFINLICADRFAVLV